MQCCQVRETKALLVKLDVTPSLGQIPFTACIYLFIETVISENTACLLYVHTSWGFFSSIIDIAICW